MAWNDGLRRGPAYDIAQTPLSPLRVMAGPGTGKTFALTRRVARLLEEGQDPSRILLVTFTRMAATDLARALDKLSIPGATAITRGTLHSFCFSLLHQQDVFEITGRVPRPLMGYEQRFLLEDLQDKSLEGYCYRWKRDLLHAFEAAWARCQHDEPGWPSDQIDQAFERQLEEWLLFHQAMLLGELVPLALEFLRSNPASPVHRRFDHVLVDEYQDLNKAEQTLIDYLSKYASVTIVGDRNQSIYESMKYAHLDGIIEYKRTHEGTRDMTLTECRRCPKSVIRIATHLIKQTSPDDEPCLQAKPGIPEGTIHVVQWLSMEDEANGIAKYIGKRIDRDEFAPGETLVLCPRRQFGYLIRDTLRDAGYAAHSFFHEQTLDGQPKKLQECQAQESFTLLRLIAYPEDRVALRCWLGFGSNTLRTKSYRRLWDYCNEHLVPPRKVLELLSTGAAQIPYTTHLVDRYRLLRERESTLASMSTREMIDDLFPAGETWAEPFRAIIERSVSEWTPQTILTTLMQEITQPELPTDVDYVRIMSLHKSKGLSVDHVIVTGFIEGLIPTYGDGESPGEARRHLQEQRRLLYVAITRPRQTLVLSSVLTLPRHLAHQMRARFSTRLGTRDRVATITSRFLKELGPSCPEPIAGADWLD